VLFAWRCFNRQGGWGQVSHEAQPRFDLSRGALDLASDFSLESPFQTVNRHELVMRRVSQWKERLSDRRASKLSINFKSDTQPPSIDPDSSLPIAYPQAAISGSNTICDRCRFLGIENSNPRQYSLPCGMFATITKSSLTSQCSLCQQFRAVFDVANDPDMSSTTHSEFILSRSILQCPVRRYDAYDFYCLGIHWKHTLEEIRLIPTHLPPRNSYDETQPLGRSLIDSIPDFSMIRGLLDKC
jgi:hypothetical protein